MNKEWTGEEIQYLKDHYPTDGSLGVATYLGRSRKAVTGIAGRLGIRSIKKISKGAIGSADDLPYKTMDYGGIS